MEVAKYKYHVWGNTTDGLNHYAAHVHLLNHIWWHNEAGNKLDLNFGERMQLILSEISEAMEGHRKDLMDDHLPQYKMLHVELADGVIRILDCSGAYNWNISYGKVDFLIPHDATNIASRLFNLSDFVIRIAHNAIDGTDPRGWLKGELVWNFIDQSEQIAFATGCSDFWQVVYDKLCYNQTRADHQYAARSKPGGKKF
jgi:hypothetical protein